ncbi:hypothetical protein F5Y01DRAFT_299761 [Xylaria sp. FL0043]|nr:hypothetical protein F5Y01DRAFT_299761 [Xylaria sp. FL0043]
MSAREGNDDKAKNSGQDKDDTQEWVLVDGPLRWELVESPDEGEQNTSETTRRWESHFDFSIGRGRWKYTLFGWDIKVEKTREVRWH